MGNCLSKRRGSLTLESTAVRPQPLPSTSPEEQETVTNTECQGEEAKEQAKDATGLSENAKDQAAADRNEHETTAHAASQVATVPPEVSDPAVVELADDVPSVQEPSNDTGHVDNEEKSGLRLQSNMKGVEENPVTLVEMAKNAKDGYKQEELFAPPGDAKTSHTVDESGGAELAGDAGSGIPVLIVTDVSTTSTTNTESSEYENQSRSLSLTNQFHDSPKESGAVSADDDASDLSQGDAVKETGNEVNGPERGELEEPAHGEERDRSNVEPPASSSAACDDVDTGAAASAGAGGAVQEDSEDVITTPATTPEASAVIPEEGCDRDQVEAGADAVQVDDNCDEE